MKYKNLEEFLAAIQHPATVQALLIDPFNKTTSFVQLPLQKEVESSDSDEGEGGGGDMGMGDRTCLYIKRDDVLQQLNWTDKGDYCTLRITVDHDQDSAMRLYMCEFTGEHPAWPGVAICGGQRTLIGRVLVTWTEDVRHDRSMASIIRGFEEEHLNLLDIKWIGAKRAESARRDEYDARIKESVAAAATVGAELISLDMGAPRCANCALPASTVESDGPSVRLKACGRCKLIRYCSVDCQKADWVNHKSVCELP